jgi:ACT domain-containing protein
MGIPNLENTVKVLGVIGALGSFIWSVHVWQEKSDQDRVAVQIILSMDIERQLYLSKQGIAIANCITEHKKALYY